MTQNLSAYLIGQGHYIPDKVLSNTDLEKIVDTSDEWICSRCGIKERHVAAFDEAPSDMGVKAAKAALDDAGLKVDDIDLIVVATMTPDMPCPGVAPLIQDKLGASHLGAFDVVAACSGYIYALAVAKAFVEAGHYRRVLLVATEKMSAMTDFTDRTTCVLFGDGAAAAVVSGEEKGYAIEAVTLGANGAHWDLMTIPAGGANQPASEKTVKDHEHFFHMRGREVYKLAVKIMDEAARECATQAGIDMDQIKVIIPHQANARIIESIGKRSERPVYNGVELYGNTSAASIPIATIDYLKENTMKKGERLLQVAFGAGSTWGAAILRKIDDEIQ